MPDKPINSMTGFGAGCAENEHATARVEIRSVNNRGSKLSVRSRPSLGAAEKNLRDIVNLQLQRGSIDVTVGLTRKLSLEQAPLLYEMAEAAIGTLRAIAGKLGLEDNLSARDLLLVPGLFGTDISESITAEEWPLIEQALNQALAQMAEMRRSEGEATAARLLEILQAIEDFRLAAMEFAPEVVQRQRQRLRERLAELEVSGRQADEQSLERELLFFADRADINEEMDRLSSHVAQFRQLLASGGEVGKRLDFLTQEMLREVNTTASKANDLRITSGAVEAKMAVEKIKEQAANLE